ncbi:hypothetical protein GOV06_02460 [Candidatus Woesearchaeota archaeon]|nr:hypothetical protein [Candidatus Woesearchaeota archaeon]
MKLEDDMKDIEGLEKKIETAKSERYEKENEIRKKIRNGESTGDEFKDFMIVNFGLVPKGYEKQYEEMEKTVNDLYQRVKDLSAGSKVLVETKQEYTHNHGRNKYVDITWQLGVLNSDFELGVENAIKFQTGEYSQRFEHDHRKTNWELAEGDIEISCMEFLYFGLEIEGKINPMRRGYRFPDADGKSVNLFVGDEVEKYFTKTKGSLDLSYVDALDLIGADVPKDLREAYDKDIYEMKIQIICDMERLSKEDKKKTEGAVEGCLKNAIKLGMHNTEWKYEMNPGVTMDVPEYIIKKCEEHGIEIPETVS